MKYIKLNPKANIFHDPGTGLTVLKGQVVEITETQARTGKIKAAISGGHLQYADKPKESDTKVDTVKELDAEALLEKYQGLLANGVVNSKIEKAFKIDELKAIALELELELEEGETKATLVEAITTELSEDE